MMDVIKRAILFGGKALVSVMDTTLLARKAQDIHGFSAPAARAMSRFLTMGAFICSGFKSKGDKLTAIIQGDGEIGKMVVCGEADGSVRCYCDNPLALADKPDAGVAQTVGVNGRLNIIKDLGLKEPYNGLTALVSGNISHDFAYYFAVSEQVNSAIALGSNTDEHGNIVVSGGIIVQPMPGCEEEILVILEDIVGNFTDVATLLSEHTPQEILDYYFGHFDIERLPDVVPCYKCVCSRQKAIETLAALGKEEAIKLAQEQGRIEIKCDFCNSVYSFDMHDVKEIFV
ncbi:MAG: Hsp33 family molecular chaperone HslO [Christensenellales bacterium]